MAGVGRTASGERSEPVQVVIELVFSPPDPGHG